MPLPRSRCLLVALASCLALAGTANAQSSFHAFESGPVTPIAMSPDGARLAVVNTPDNRVEIFSLGGAAGLRRIRSVQVGMEPVSVAFRNDNELWVVNHLSDSVSVVSDPRGAETPRVVRTLLVGDEPRGIVFAGPDRAFITTAHRGQQRTNPAIQSAFDDNDGDPELTTPSVPRADVWVFDAANPGGDIGGVPLAVVELFGDTPRALAVSPDGNTVYAAVFHSGNQTAVVSEGRVCDGWAGQGPCNGDGVTVPGGLGGGQMPGGNPGPSDNVTGVTAPEVGLVVQWDPVDGRFEDELGRNWNNGIRFTLPDYDVFRIDANTLAKIPVTGDPKSGYAHVGTILFNMAVNPVNGKIYVSNTDSQNLTRFEGAGDHGGTTVQGNLAHSRITVIDPGAGSVKPRHLNRHIDYSVLPAPAGTKDHSLATPMDLSVSADGSKLYVVAWGSGKLGVFDTADLENDALFDGAGAEFDPTVESANYVSLSGGGPAGVVLDEARDRAYVATRWDNGLSVVDLDTLTETAHLTFFNPEPPLVTDGRFMLYDANLTSSNGEASCSSCHIFGDFDSLAWDLGDPDGGITDNSLTINLNIAAGDQNGGAANDEFHPMKGPMTTQTLRGLVTSGHMHWRADRVDGFFGFDSPNTNDSDLSFRNFIVAFPGLVGLDIALDPFTTPEANKSQEQKDLEADMQAFSDFMLEVLLPPNPVRALSNALNGDQQAGKDFFQGNGPGNVCSDGLCFLQGFAGFTCDGCHTLDPGQGFFGTGGNASFENELQIFKVPHLRNMYQKVGMFGMPNVPFNNPGDNSFQGDQVRGTGFLHDGSTDTLFRFFNATVFNDQNGSGFDGGDPQRRQVEEFMMAFDTDLAPIVGQQVTLRQGSPQAAIDRVNFLLQVQAGTPFVSAVLGGNVDACDLVATRNNGDGLRRGYLYDPGTGNYVPDAVAEPGIPFVTFVNQALQAGNETTFTCVPPGAGTRVALDRDEDGVFDYDEVLALTDADSAASFPGACNNGLDDDGDGFVDVADPGCADATGNDEAPQCDDGNDNDADGVVDVADSNCSSAADDSEFKMSCGLGAEGALAMAGLLWLRRRRRA